MMFELVVGEARYVIGGHTGGADVIMVRHEETKERAASTLKPRRDSCGGSGANGVEYIGKQHLPLIGQEESLLSPIVKFRNLCRICNTLSKRIPGRKWEDGERACAYECHLTGAFKLNPGCAVDDART